MTIEVTHTLLNGVQVRVEGPDPKNIFHSLALIGESLGEDACGKCGSNKIRMDTRRVQDNDFYGWRCLACGAQLDMGQHKTGKTLFAKRTLPDGTYDTKHHGWYMFSERRPQSGSSPSSAAGGQSPTESTKQQADSFF